MNPRSSIGVYFQAEKVHLVCLLQEFIAVSVKDCLTLSLPAGGDEEAYKEKLQDFFRKNHDGSGRVYAAVDRKDSIMSLIELPSPAEENLAEVLGYELDSYTPYSKEEACFGYRIAGRDQRQNTVSVVLAVVLKKRLEECLDALKVLGIGPAAAEISSTALSEVFLYGGKTGAGRFVFINPDEETGEIVLFENGLPHYSRPLRMSGPGAETLALEVGKGLKARGWEAGTVDGLILKDDNEGGAGVIAGELEGLTGIRASLVEGLPAGPDGKALGARYMVPLGLALRDASINATDVNLITRAPEPGEQRQEYRKLIPFAAVTLFLLMTLLLTPLLKKMKTSGEINERLEALRPEVEAVAGMKEEILGLEAKIEQMESILGARTRALRIVKELTEVVPQDTWLTDLRYRRTALEIGGYSASASSLISLLEESPYFTQVEFSAPVTVTGTTGAPDTTDASVFIRNRVKRTGSPASDTEQFKIKAVMEVRR